MKTTFAANSDGTAKKKVRGRPFQKGQSGNKRGRPKRDNDLAALARTYAADAIDTLACIMNDGKAPAAARIKAASELLSRGYGTAPRAIDVSVSHNFSRELSSFLRRLHHQETGQVVENQGNSGLIDTDDAIEVEFDEVVEES